MVERESVIEGCRIHYTEGGAGDTVVLMLHGGGPGSNGMTNFGACLPYLEKETRVLVPDQPGFGTSEFVQPETSYMEMSANLMVRLLDELGIGRAHVIGNSLGGGVALCMARDHPERVGKLVLMNPAGASVALLHAETPEMGMIRDYYSDPGPSRERMRQFAGEMVKDIDRVPEALIEERYQISLLPGAREGMERAMRSFDPRTEGAEARAAQRGMLWTQLQTIRNPALLLWGREDRAAPLDRAWFLEARLPNAHLYVFPNCGHWIQLEWPREFASIVRTFLDN